MQLVESILRPPLFVHTLVARVKLGVLIGSCYSQKLGFPSHGYAHVTLHEGGNHRFIFCTFWHEDLNKTLSGVGMVVFG